MFLPPFDDTIDTPSVARGKVKLLMGREYVHVLVVVFLTGLLSAPLVTERPVRVISAAVSPGTCSEKVKSILVVVVIGSPLARTFVT